MIAFDDPNPLAQRLAFEKRYASVLATVHGESPTIISFAVFFTFNYIVYCYIYFILFLMSSSSSSYTHVVQ